MAAPNEPYSRETVRRRREAQEGIVRLCQCGRRVRGNPGWWSHTHRPDGTERDGHGIVERES